MESKPIIFVMVFFTLTNSCLAASVKEMNQKDILEQMQRELNFTQYLIDDLTKFVNSTLAPQTTQSPTFLPTGSPSSQPTEASTLLTTGSSADPVTVISTMVSSASSSDMNTETSNGFVSETSTGPSTDSSAFTSNGPSTDSSDFTSSGSSAFTSNGPSTDSSAIMSTHSSTFMSTKQPSTVSSASASTEQSSVSSAFTSIKQPSTDSSASSTLHGIQSPTNRSSQTTSLLSVSTPLPSKSPTPLIQKASTEDASTSTQNPNFCIYSLRATEGDECQTLFISLGDVKEIATDIERGSSTEEKLKELMRSSSKLDMAIYVVKGDSTFSQKINLKAFYDYENGVKEVVQGASSVVEKKLKVTDYPAEAVAFGVMGGLFLLAFLIFGGYVIYTKNYLVCRKKSSRL